MMQLSVIIKIEPKKDTLMIQRLIFCLQMALNDYNMRMEGDFDSKSLINAWKYAAEPKQNCLLMNSMFELICTNIECLLKC